MYEESTRKPLRRLNNR